MTMDPLASGNYEDVPDKIPQIDTGMYTLRCNDFEYKEPEGNYQDGTPRKDWSLNLKVEVIGDINGQPTSPIMGRKQTIYLNVPPGDDQSDTALNKRIRMKQYFSAMAIPPQGTGYDVNKLKGAIFKAESKLNVYTDKAGKQVSNQQINPLKTDGSKF